MIKASDYYRKMLKAESKQEEIGEKPDLIAGLEMIDNSFNNSVRILINKIRY